MIAVVDSLAMKSKLDHLLYRLKYRYGKWLPLEVPVDISLELSSRCNMACSYCYHSKDNEPNLPFKKGMMDRLLAIGIIQEAAVLGVHSLKFNYRGESTVHPHFKEITGAAKKLAGGRVFIDRITNSNFKFRSDREDIFEGLCNQTKVKVSYDSFSKAVFESQRKGGDHALTTRNIDLFYNHALRKNTELVLQAVRTSLNRHEDIEGEVKKRWPSATLSIREVVDGRKQQSIGDLANKHRDFSNRQSCLQAHVRLIITHEGKCIPCCPDIKEDLVLGDVRFESLRKIFSGPIAKQLRKDLISKKAFEKSPCSTCPAHESYKGYRPAWTS